MTIVEELVASVYLVGGCYGTSHFFQGPQITSTNILESCTVSKRDAIMIPLLNACVNKLRDQGMKQMFLDAVIEHVESYERLGECLNYRSNHWALIVYTGFKKW